jgi:hypothetical protein
MPAGTRPAATRLPSAVDGRILACALARNGGVLHMVTAAKPCLHQRLAQGPEGDRRR